MRHGEAALTWTLVTPNTVNVRHRRAVGRRGPLNGGKDLKPLRRELVRHRALLYYFGRQTPDRVAPPRAGTENPCDRSLRTFATNDQEHLVLKHEQPFFWQIFFLSFRQFRWDWVSGVEIIAPVRARKSLNRLACLFCLFLKQSIVELLVWVSLCFVSYGVNGVATWSNRWDE